MYTWLTESLLESGTIVTANSRLARLLKQEYAIQQRNKGVTAWESPRILAWQDWLLSTSNAALVQTSIPTRISAQQSQWLWEKCWCKDIGDDVRIGNLVKLSRDAWQRLADWQISISEVKSMAQGAEQQAFAKVAGRYLGLLQHENMVDDAGLGAIVHDMIHSAGVVLTGVHTFAGFDRQRPITIAITDAIKSTGLEIHSAPPVQIDNKPSLQAFESSAAEQRAAGAWARSFIYNNPKAKVAIVASGLESDADSITRHVREGATPGWQYGHHSLFEAVNVSYGRRLADYPAITIALTALRWLVRDLNSSDLGLLMRSPLLGSEDTSARHQLELKLRKLPGRAWTPSMVTSQFRSRNENDEGDDWLSRLAALSKRRREVPEKASPEEWAEFVDETLRLLGWPGESALDSVDFQLVNRWRELLNEFARLALVSSKISAATALARIELLAVDTVFQPESVNASIQLIGSLEAAGSQFDALWISGLTSSNWPPAGTRSMLISRRLQEKYGMPDCSPADTLSYAKQVLSRLLYSAEYVVCSYAIQDDDTEQTVSSLLNPITAYEPASREDPGWIAATMTSLATAYVVEDSVPAVHTDEKISGGAAAIQRQMTDPVSGFIQSRLGARQIDPQVVGIPPPMRGNLIHDALYKLYIERPNSESIRGWQDSELTQQIAVAVDYAFARHEKNSDSTLRQLLILERNRLTELLRRFVIADGDRGNFEIKSVEGEFEFVSGRIQLPLRFDRLEACDGGGIAILDYKTGARKKLLNKRNEVQEIQLFVYACATEAPVSALALVNIDSREISFDGAGLDYSDFEKWPELLRQIKNKILLACADLEAGDVRINIEQGVQAARPLNLLTRYTELLRDDG
jgi:ATP-dependent helicase/nuclease subunit B